MSAEEYLSKRLQQVMEEIYRRGRVTATELQKALPWQPTNSTTRTHLRILEERGLLGHEEIDGKFVYFSIHEPPTAAKSALRRMLDTFFGGSTEAAFAALLDVRDTELSQAEFDRLQELIDQARGEKK